MQVADKSNWAMPIGVFHLVSWISLFWWGLILFVCLVRSALRQAGMINYRHNGGKTAGYTASRACSTRWHILNYLFIFFFCCTILNKLAVAAWQLWFALHVRMHVATPTPQTPTGTQRIVILWLATLVPWNMPRLQLQPHLLPPDCLRSSPNWPAPLTLPTLFPLRSICLPCHKPRYTRQTSSWLPARQC